MCVCVGVHGCARACMGVRVRAWVCACVHACACVHVCEQVCVAKFAIWTHYIP